MSRLVCGTCQIPVGGRDVTCPRCGAALYAARSALIIEPDAPVGPPPPPPAPPAAPAPSRPAGDAPRRAPRPRITITFETGSVELPQQRETLLGRDSSSPVASLLQWYENVSRGHATVTVEPDGGIWLRDEGSVNGTSVDGKPVRPGRPVPLRDGVRLHLAGVEAVVTVGTV